MTFGLINEFAFDVFGASTRAEAAAAVEQWANYETWPELAKSTMSTVERFRRRRGDLAENDVRAAVRVLLDPVEEFFVFEADFGPSERGAVA